jgi:putative SOS response-associated peptidase YedK
MCNHKSLAEKEKDLTDHYKASFEAIKHEIEYIKERFTILNTRNQEIQPYTASEKSLVRSYQKTLASFVGDEIRRYHEVAFDHLLTPIITAVDSSNLHLYSWGLIAPWVKTFEEADEKRKGTVNCTSEERFTKSSWRDAANKGQRCLIPVSGFYEWKHLDPKGKNKIPYRISFKDQRIMSLAGLYSSWKNPETGEVFNTYTILTTEANPLMAEIHNSGKRMPVVIPKEYERDWLSSNLMKEDVLALCQPISDSGMKAHTVSELLSKFNSQDTNFPEVMQPREHQKIEQQSLF